MIKEITLPDIGQFSGVEIIELLVKPGDTVAAEAPIMTLESDKASIEIPIPVAGKVKSWHVHLGDKVSQGDRLLSLEITDEETEKPVIEAVTPVEQAYQSPEPKHEQVNASDSAKKSAQVADTESELQAVQSTVIHAGPVVRQLARELEVDLQQVNGTGPCQRITRPDLIQYVKTRINDTGHSAHRGSALPEMPVVDFSAFGPVEQQPLPRIKRLSAHNLHRNWVVIPHVTHFDYADITELEEFRQQSKEMMAEKGARLTLLSFLMKAVVNVLKVHPSLNSSLSPDGQSWYLKHYYHIGIAVDTPSGLVVPVIRDVDQKSLSELALELAKVSEQARAGKLKATDMQGSSMSISSLGGIGGQHFTPIINAPDVAILGVTKANLQPVWQGNEFIPRLMLPLSLSYDHRVIDGAQAARCMNTLVSMLTDIRNLML